MRHRLARALRALTLLAPLAVPSAAFALPPECPLFFPDFRCGRHGRYEGFVPPMMHPYLFEDPFITTGLSAWGIWQQFPHHSLLDGGEMWVAALQARVAITDRIGFVATKDGWVIDRQPGLSLLEEENGFTDLTAGIKVAAIDMPEVPFILTPSLRVELTNGSSEVFQGNGEGVLIPQVSAAWGWGNFHVIGDFGSQIPFDSDAESTSLFYHLHLDYAVRPWLVPFVEVGGFTYLDGGTGKTKVELADGTRIPLEVAQDVLGKAGFEGYDYANLGSQGVAGNDVIAWAVGVRAPIGRHVVLGAAYELPLTQRRDLLSQRASVNVTLEF